MPFPFQQLVIEEYLPKFFFIDRPLELRPQAPIINPFEKCRMVIIHILVMHVGLQIREVEQAIVTLQHVEEVGDGFTHGVYILLIELDVYLIYWHAVEIGVDGLGFGEDFTLHLLLGADSLVLFELNLDAVGVDD